MEYLVLKHEDLDSIARDVDVDYQTLYKQYTDAHATKGVCVYFRRFTQWYWVVVDERIPIDWFMALVMA